MISKNSTNIRFMNLLLPALRAATGVEAMAAMMAARLGESLMFRTHRRERTAEEQAILGTGRAFRVPSAHGGLAAWRWGEGPQVLLVHGWNGRGSQLGGFVGPLVEAGFGVVMLDAPGHGDSPGHRSSLPDFASAIEATVDAVRPLGAPLHGVIAHSMGGPATILASHRTLHAEETSLERGLREARLPFRRFVLVAPPIDVRDFLRGFSERVGLGQPVQDVLQKRIEARFATRLSELYAPELVREFEAPLLVLHDAQDKEVPADRGRTLSAAWPGGLFEETQGLGHVRILRDPQIVGRVVRFLRDLLPRVVP